MRNIQMSCSIIKKDPFVDKLEEGSTFTKFSLSQQDNMPNLISHQIDEVVFFVLECHKYFFSAVWPLMSSFDIVSSS